MLKYFLMTCSYESSILGISKLISTMLGNDVSHDYAWVGGALDAYYGSHRVSCVTLFRRFLTGAKY